MKVVLLDDEILQLNGLKNKLESDFNGLEVVGAFVNPYELLDKIDALNPEVIFLDIHLPGIQGIEVANIIQEKAPHMEFVFITGFDQYAIQAFELFAFDYILKPIQSKRLEKTITRLINKKSDVLPAATPIPKLTINCFQSLRLFNESGTEIPIKWRTSKALELFAYFIHNKGTVIERDTLLELFWPELDEARAAQQLYTTIYHIRKVLKTGKIDSIHLVHSKEYFGGYVLKTDESVVFETEKWENELKSIHLIEKQNEAVFAALLLQYEGDYCGSYDFTWAEAEQERLRKFWLYHMYVLCHYYINEKQSVKAVQQLIDIQKKQPYEEEAYFKLMKLYAETNQNYLVEEQFRNLTEKMEDLGVETSSIITAWFAQWQTQPVT